MDVGAEFKFLKDVESDLDNATHELGCVRCAKRSCCVLVVATISIALVALVFWSFFGTRV